MRWVGRDPCLCLNTGIWIGDNTGGGSGNNHQTDMSYGWNGVAFQANTYITSDRYSVYFRSKSNVGAAKVSGGGAPAPALFICRGDAASTPCLHHLSVSCAFDCTRCRWLSRVPLPFASLSSVMPPVA